MAATHCRPLSFRKIPKFTVANRKRTTAMIPRTQDTAEFAWMDLSRGVPSPQIDAITTRIE